MDGETVVSALVGLLSGGGGMRLLRWWQERGEKARALDRGDIDAEREHDQLMRSELVALWKAALTRCDELVSQCSELQNELLHAQRMASQQQGACDQCRAELERKSSELQAALERVELLESALQTERLQHAQMIHDLISRDLQSPPSTLDSAPYPSEPTTVPDDRDTEPPAGGEGETPP